MENILEIAGDGGLTIPASTLAELGWGPGGKVMLRRTEDSFTLHSLPMSARAGARELHKTVADLQGETVTERDTREVHRIQLRKR